MIVGYDFVASLKALEVAPNHSFLRELKESDISTCYQCQKCSSGCPVAYAMDFPPHVLLHMAQLGLKDEVLGSSTIWLCASCETCTTRCPNGIDIAKVMDSLREMALRSGVKPGEKHIPAFHRAFLASIKGKGRVSELGMIVGYKLRSGELFKDLGLGWQMLRRGKLKLLAKKARGVSEVRGLFQGPRRRM